MFLPILPLLVMSEVVLGGLVLTAQPAIPPARPLLMMYSGLRLSTFWCFCPFFSARASSSVGHIGGSRKERRGGATCAAVIV
jgi:hypothetical protein